MGALCCVGRGFGRAGRAGPGWAQIRLCLARSAGRGVGWGLALVGALGWVRIWLSVYGLHCTCLLHVFMMSLCLSSCVSQMVSWGLSKTEPGIRE